MSREAAPVGLGKAPLLLLAPFVVALAIFFATPLLLGARESLLSNTLYGESSFVGLEHYRALLSDSRYWLAWQNTLGLALANLICIVPLALALAVLLQRCHPRARGPLRFALILPGLTPPAVLGLLFVMVFDGPHGLLNSALTQPIGLPAIDWLRDPHFILPALVLQAIWRWSGFAALFLEAGLGGIPRTHYELANCEGAKDWRRFLYVTLPGLRRSLIFVGVFLLLDAFSLFVGAYVLLGGSGGTADAGLLLVGYAYQTAFTYGEFGSAAAVGFSIALIFAVVASAVLVARRVLARPKASPARA